MTIAKNLNSMFQNINPKDKVLMIISECQDIEIQGLLAENFHTQKK
jgi:hypothetical protein